MTTQQKPVKTHSGWVVPSLSDLMAVINSIPQQDFANLQDPITVQEIPGRLFAVDTPTDNIVTMERRADGTIRYAADSHYNYRRPSSSYAIPMDRPEYCSNLDTHVNDYIDQYITDFIIDHWGNQHRGSKRVRKPSRSLITKNRTRLLNHLPAFLDQVLRVNYNKLLDQARVRMRGPAVEHAIAVCLPNSQTHRLVDMVSANIRAITPLVDATPAVVTMWLKLQDPYRPIPRVSHPSQIVAETREILDKSLVSTRRWRNLCHYPPETIQRILNISLSDLENIEFLRAASNSRDPANAVIFADGFYSYRHIYRQDDNCGSPHCLYNDICHQAIQALAVHHGQKPMTGREIRNHVSEILEYANDHHNYFLPDNASWPTIRSIIRNARHDYTIRSIDNSWHRHLAEARYCEQTWATTVPEFTHDEINVREITSTVDAYRIARRLRLYVIRRFPAYEDNTIRAFLISHHQLGESVYTIRKNRHGLWDYDYHEAPNHISIHPRVSAAAERATELFTQAWTDLQPPHNRIPIPQEFRPPHNFQEIFDANFCH